MPLVGRRGEMAVLEDELARAAAGEFRVVLLSGEAGVGKSRLGRELLARHPGAAGMFARANPLGVTAAFGVWTEAIGPLLQGMSDAQVTAVCSGLLDDLASLFHRVAVVRGSLPGREPPLPRLLQGLAALLRNLAAEAPAIDLEEGTVRVRRSAGMVRVAGESAGVVEGDTKSGKPRLVDLDGPTVAVLRARKRERGALALQLARDDALVFGDVQGDHRNPEHVSRQFARDIARARAELGDQALPVIRLHDLRHTHATILLTAREPVHVVSQRLGHASAVVTMTVYAHVLPGSQRDAANLFARLIEETGSPS